MKNTLTILIALLLGTAANAQTSYYQQCEKMPAPTPVAHTAYGWATSLSADGSTAVVGVPGDAGNTGAAYVYTRSGCYWTNPVKLTGTGSIGAAYQGQSIAISSDGNTIISGGPGDNNGVGGAWIFVKSSGVWSQQAKLIGTGYTGAPLEAYSVSVSGDGNTAILGGPLDNTDIGAVWVFSRSGSSWSQMGPKIVGSGYSFNNVEQGTGTAISADGNTMAFGGPPNNAGNGGAWIFTRSGNSWAQQSLLTGTTLYPHLGNAISLSADGNTAAVGAADAGNNTGTYGQGHVEIFTRTGTTWARQGNYLLGTNAIGYAQQGCSVGLTADGNTLVFGGGANLYPTNASNISAGQFWVFTRSGNTWTQQGQKYIGTNPTGNSQQGSSVSISGDGKTIITGGFADKDSAGAVWTFATTQCTSACPPPLTIATSIIPANSITAFPNPSGGTFTLSIPNASSKEIFVSIANAIGQQIKSFSLSTNDEYKISLDAPNGLYYLHATDGSGNSYTIKLQINH